ncbi:MAG: DUF5615 family PIN-like protein [Dehalococcoidia bacterium]
MASFYLDHNVAVNIAFLLRAINHAGTTANEAGLGSTHDDEHLLFAAQHGLTLVTHNRTDFVLLHGAWRRWGVAWNASQSHAGVLIVPQPPLATNNQIAQELDGFLAGEPSLTNELYQWRPSSGWQRQES